MTNEKTVAERLREKPEKRSLECWLAKSVVGIVCDRCSNCYDKCTNVLADMIEAEQAKLKEDVKRKDDLAFDLFAKHCEIAVALGVEGEDGGVEATHRKIMEKICLTTNPNEAKSGVDVDALLELADRIAKRAEIPSYIDTMVSHGDLLEYSNDIRDAVKGAKASKPMPLDADGQPCFLDDAVWHKGRKHLVVAVSHKGKVCIRDWETRDSGSGAVWVKAERVTRRKPDTQEDIDTDARLSFLEYTKKYPCPIDRADDPAVWRREHLLARQRKLMGGE